MNRLRIAVVFTLMITMASASLVYANEKNENEVEPLDKVVVQNFDSKSTTIELHNEEKELVTQKLVTDTSNIYEIIIGQDDLVKVKNPLEYPYSTSVYIESSNNNLTYRGSGNFIADNVVLTAAHVVYDKNANKFLENVKIYAGDQGDAGHMYSSGVKKISILDSYKTNGKFENDLAVIILDKPLGAKLGHLGLYSNSSDYKGEKVTITGYPAKSREKIMYTDKKNILSDEGGLLSYKIDTLGGSSGSVLYDSKHNAIGVHVMGNEKEQKNYAVKLNDTNLSHVNSILKQATLNGWEKVNNEWYYYKHNHREKGWINDNNKWYYLGDNGVMQVGWIKYNNKWYYLDASGAMQVGWIKLNDKWYYLASDGTMQTGWLQLNGKWYYLSSSGEMQTGWIEIGGVWYYMKQSGEMVTGTHTINGKVYKFSDTGAWIE